MQTVLLSLFLLSGLIFVGVVMLMTPKGWLWLWMGGMANTWEYGSQKSLEVSLKRIAFWSGLVFLVVTVILPFVE